MFQKDHTAIAFLYLYEWSCSHFSLLKKPLIIYIIVFQSFNILRYEIGQRYHSHYDAFNPAEYGPQKSQRVRKVYIRLLLRQFYCQLCF